jgi:hypothetical protein
MRTSVLDRLDRLLRPLRSAFHNISCATYPFQPAEKERIISEIFEWANDSLPVHECTPVYLLQGDSRSAVTTIVHGVMSEARNKGRLLASYFVSWNREAERLDPTDLIPTIIYQFAQYDKTFLRPIADAVAVDRDIRDRDTNTQIRTLFDLPLNDITLPSGPLPLLVIDALDACGVVRDTAVASGISSFIARLTGKSSFRIKLLISCRSARIVKRILEQPGSQTLYRSSVVTH